MKSEYLKQERAGKGSALVVWCTLVFFAVDVYLIARHIG
jgi:hypothetical protein